jgi:SAM-dependent methyltransferase
MSRFASFDRRNYRTVPAREGYAQWAATYEETIKPDMDLCLLEKIQSVRWSAVAHCADLGCGTGAVAQSLAPFVERVIAVDESAAMLSAAKKRLHGVGNIDIRNGRLESLPIGDGEVDVALLFLVLHYTADPSRVIAQASRVLKPGGRLLVLDMMPHDRQDLRQTMGHLWAGFDRATLDGWMQSAGFESFRYNALPPDTEAKGPTLFAASGKRSAAAMTSGGRKKADAAPLMKSA